MANPTYLDASALMRWASGLTVSPESRDTNGRAAVEAMISAGVQTVCTTVTLAEVISNLHIMYRADEAGDWRAAFGDPELEAVEKQMMEWLATDQLHVRNLSARAFEMGMSYVAALSRDHRQKIQVWDGIHIYEAARWARELECKVDFATSDSDYEKFFLAYPEFLEHLVVVDVTT